MMQKLLIYEAQLSHNRLLTGVWCAQICRLPIKHWLERHVGSDMLVATDSRVWRQMH
jgi:hypothetical protein